MNCIMKTIKIFLSMLFCIGTVSLFLSSCGKYEAPDIEDYYNNDNFYNEEDDNDYYDEEEDDEEEDEDDGGYSGYIQCVLCDGSGICDLCHGDGILSSGKECNYCDGTGICHHCDGTGRIYYY